MIIELLAVVSAAGENIEYYKQHIIVGAELQSSEQTGELSANILYSNMALHGAPISLNMFLNAYLKSMAGPDYSISTANSPLQGFAEPSTVQNQSAIQNGLFWLSMFPLGAQIVYILLICGKTVFVCRGVHNDISFLGVPPAGVQEQH